MSFFKRLSFFILFLTCFSTFLMAKAKPVEVTVSSKRLNIGDVLIVSMYSDRPVERSSISFTGRSFSFFKTHLNEYRYVAYIAAARRIKEKSYPLTVYVKFKDGGSFKDKVDIKVIRPDFEEGHVTLSKSKNNLSKSNDRLVNEAQIIGKRYNLKTYKRYFSGKFIRPAAGRVSSEFGKVRVYNNSYKRSHAGLDIANEEGTLVKASNSGKVVYSDYLPVHGHTVMIDHGRGVVSIYNHLMKRLVKTNAFVKKGQHIGRIGQTGVATGPHLHWGISVQNVRIDPLYLTKQKLY